MDVVRLYVWVCMCGCCEIVGVDVVRLYVWVCMCGCCEIVCVGVHVWML